MTIRLHIFSPYHGAWTATITEERLGRSQVLKTYFPCRTEKVAWSRGARYVEKVSGHKPERVDNHNWATVTELPEERA